MKKYIFTVIILLITFDLLADNLNNLFCYPNPFSPYTNTGKIYIQYQLSSDARISVKIFTLTGDLVYYKNYEKGIVGISSASTGTVEINWNGKNNDGRYVADGGYILQITADNGEKTITKFVKVLIIKDL